MAKRIILDIAIFLSIFLAPFWFTVLFAIALLFVFDDFYEILPIFFLIDLLYPATGGKFGGVMIVSLILAIVLLVTSNIFKKKMRPYK